MQQELTQQQLDNEILHKAGICPACLQEYVHAGDEPLAHCGCPGTIEWTGKPPLLWSLRQESLTKETTMTEGTIENPLNVVMAAFRLAKATLAWDASVPQGELTGQLIVHRVGQILFDPTFLSRIQGWLDKGEVKLGLRDQAKLLWAYHGALVRPGATQPPAPENPAVPLVTATLVEAVLATVPEGREVTVLGHRVHWKGTVLWAVDNWDQLLTTTDATRKLRDAAVPGAPLVDLGEYTPDVGKIRTEIARIPVGIDRPVLGFRVFHTASDVWSVGSGNPAVIGLENAMATVLYLHCREQLAPKTVRITVPRSWEDALLVSHRGVWAYNHHDYEIGVGDRVVFVDSNDPDRILVVGRVLAHVPRSSITWGATGEASALNDWAFIWDEEKHDK